MNLKKIKKYKTLALLSILLLLIGFYFLKTWMTYFLIVVLSLLIHSVSYEMKFRINFGHVFFLSMIVMKHIGAVKAIVYILVAELYPRIANQDIDLKTFILVPIEVIFVLSLLIIDISIVRLGIILAVLYHIIAFVVAKTLGDTLLEIAEEIGVSFLLNIVYFVSLSGPISSLVANVVA